MTDQIGGKKIRGVKSTGETKGVEQTGAISEVDDIKATTGVGSVKGVTGVGGTAAARGISFAERQKLFEMVDEEAEKLFGKDGITADKRALVKQAVKMAMDSVLLDDKDKKITNKNK